MDGWQDLEPEVKAAPVSAPVRFGLRVMAKGRARGVVLVRREVVTALAMSTHRVDVRLGTGANTHLLAIVPSDSGRFELLEMGTAKGGGTFRVMLPHIDKWPNTNFSVMAVGHEIQEQGKKRILVVKLPPVCWDAATRERALKAASVRPSGPRS
ncbi:hypothetical protein [Ancylobacter sp. SL191]|uniref:hypothetical protein n=1 Tax=Ancylobacter sp. SL191 TaxID=2995166 RepID=UPI0022718B89|nr:hypothetical protein [Ancylobacter sp. SL191]WAC26403.1 hypothetical protein OU996_15460 [Ancylobacter sp. SL191]